MCSAVDRARFTIHKTISAPNVSPHVPPPFTALYSWRAASVSFRMSRCEHLPSGTTNSFILPQMSTLVQMLLMSKPPDVQIHKAVACPAVWEANRSSLHMLQTAKPPLQSRMSRGLRGNSSSSLHMLLTANPPGLSLRCEPFAAKMLTPVSWPSWSSNCSNPFNTIIQHEVAADVCLSFINFNQPILT